MQDKFGFMNGYSPVVMVVGPNGCRSMFGAGENAVLREEIIRNISYPDFALKSYLEGIVNMDLSTNESGQVVISGSNATHPGLLDYVSQRIRKIVLREKNMSERQIRLILKFIMY
jgi:hypothetical protein